jgi:hypothetical protein
MFSTDSDANYFRRRASEERLAAMKAAHPEARSAHLELATRYDDLSDEIGRHELRVSMSLLG